LGPIRIDEPDLNLIEDQLDDMKEFPGRSWYDTFCWFVGLHIGVKPIVVAVIIECSLAIGGTWICI